MLRMSCLAAIAALASGCRTQPYEAKCIDTVADQATADVVRDKGEAILDDVNVVMKQGYIIDRTVADRPIFELNQIGMAQCRDRNFPAKVPKGEEAFDGVDCTLAKSDGDGNDVGEFAVLPRTWDTIPAEIAGKFDNTNKTKARITYAADFKDGKGFTVYDILTDGKTCFTGVGDGSGRFKIDAREICPETCKSVADEMENRLRETYNFGNSK